MSSKSPEIRFNGYTDDWEQRKLGELANIFGGGTPSTKNPDYWNGNIDWYSPAEIGEQIYLHGSVKKITELGLKKSSAKILPVGSILFTSRAGIGNTAILAKEGSTNQGFQSIVPHKNELISYFVYSRTNELKRYGEITGAGSTFVEVSGKQMAKMPMKTPTLEEQSKIGNFFEQLDNTIALHQRELDNLLKSKKGFLQKMFPKQGGKVPEVRFSKFAKDWKQHDLKDIYKKSNEKNKNLKYGKEYIISVAKMQYKENDSVSSEDYMKTYNVMKKNDIAFEGNKSKKYKYGRFVLNDIGDGIVSHVFIVMRPKMEMSASFLKEYINNESVMQQILLFSTTSTLMMTTLNTKEFLEQKLRLPSLEEQLEIGSFFEELDSSIFLKQKQLNNLKQTKKAFLQKMFV